MRRLTTTALVVLALVAAGCTTDDESDTATADPTTTGPGAGPEGSDADQSSPPQVGVSEDTITVAVAQIDLDLVREMGLAQVNHGDYELIYRTFVEDINDRGGIHDRRVELLYDTWDVTKNAEAEALCTRFTEDTPVFAVLGGIRGDNMLCLTEQHDTLVVGQDALNQEQIERSNGLVVTPNAQVERGIETSAAAFDGAGLLDDEVIAIHGAATAEASAEAMRAAVEAAGHEVALVTLSTESGGDTQAADDEFTVYAERYRADGVTTVIIVGNTTTVIDGVARAGLDVQILADMARSGEVSGAGRDRPEETRGIISVFPADIEGPAQTADPELAACIETFEAANPDVEVPEMRSVEPGEPDWAIGIRIACQVVRLFELGAQAAGPELTSASFVAAVEGLGDVELAAQPYTSFGPGKIDGNDGALLVEFDPDQGDSGNYVALGELIDTTSSG